jgi:tetratricopeptide (TPR) repeat protein
MAWRVLVSSPTLAPEPALRAGRMSGAPPSRSSHGLRTSFSPPRPTSLAPPFLGQQSMLPDARRSLPPATPSESVTTTACVQLLDQLLLADQAPFVLAWIENAISTRNRSDPAIAVRLVRTYREAGKLDRARDLAASLPNAPVTWPPLEQARLGIERAILATVEGRPDHADAELRLATRALNAAPKGTGLREQLDLHVAQAQLDATLDRVDGAMQTLRLTELVADRLEEGPWRAPLSMTLGHIAMKLADPRTAAKHYAGALARVASRGPAAMTAHGNLAIALGSVGQFDDGRRHALCAIDIARETAPGWRHADGCDVLAVVEIAADQPLAALQNLDEGLGVLGDFEHPMLRYQLTEHRAWALAMLGRAQAARQWLAKAEQLRADLGAVDVIEDQDLVSTRARTLEASNQPQGALEAGLEHVALLPEAFVTGSLNLTVGRCALAVGDESTARASVERAALSGEGHGWVFPDRQISLPLWQLALKSGDSRVVRYAERMINVVDKTSTKADIALSLLPSQRPALPVSIVPMEISEGTDEHGEGEVFVYVTTPNGVTRVALSEVGRATDGASLVVDTLTHALRVHDREVSLERRRALEPLVVQLLRRAREGLSAEEILRAAGGPGPESADAEHRVRVLISRVRDLLGDAASIERVRDAGEHGRTRYRLAADARFALVEPLYSPTIPP